MHTPRTVTETLIETLSRSLLSLRLNFVVFMCMIKVLSFTHFMSKTTTNIKKATNVQRIKKLHLNKVILKLSFII